MSKTKYLFPGFESSLVFFLFFSFIGIFGPAQAAKAKTDFDLKLGPKEWQDFGEPQELDDDLVILKNGTKIKGVVESLPPIKYSFASISFKVKEVAAISILHEGQPKIRYVTHMGENYSGSLSSEPLKFLKKETVSKSISRKKEKETTVYVPIELELESIDFILLKPRGSIRPLRDEEFYTLHLVNGDRFAFKEHTHQIYLLMGNTKSSVYSREIQELRQVREGLQGFLLREGLDKELPFSLLLDKTYTVKLARNSQLLEVPWEEIYKIKKDAAESLTKIPYFFTPEKLLGHGVVYVPPGHFFLGNYPTHNLMEEPSFELQNSQLLTSSTSAQVLRQFDTQLQDNSPATMIEAPGFYIDRYEVTNEQYLEFVEDTGHRFPIHWTAGKIPKGKETHPVVNVSYEDAASYAAWVGKRLPSEVEWERAAKLSTSFAYPYGPTYDNTLSNTESEDTVSVGSFEGLKSQDNNYPKALLPQTQDMSGNVQEWTSTAYSPYWFAKLSKHSSYPDNPQNRSRNPQRVVRGGSFLSSAPTATTTYRSSMHEEDYNNYTGFRCVMDEFIGN